MTIIDAGSTPTYLQIRPTAAHMRELGLSDRAIARANGMRGKTAAKRLLPEHEDPSVDPATIVEIAPRDG